MNGLQKLAKIGEANGMPSLQTGNRYVTKTGNVGSVENRESQWYASLPIVPTQFALGGKCVFSGCS